LTLANLQIYAQVMHGQASVVGGPIPPPSVLPPGPGCDGGLTATGTLSVDSVACAADPATGLDTCNISVGKRVDISATATQTADEFVYWGDGSGIENPPVSHTYNNIGHFQVIQTVKNPCGYSAQKVMIVNVTGGSNGKGTMTITAGDATGRKISYSVMASGSLVSLTNGAITIGGYLDGSKTITLDAGTYDVKIGYSSVVPLTDPIAYHACDQDASGTLLQKCSNPSYGGQLTCEAAGAAWQTTGQLITGVVVDPNVPATVTLTNCD
jgi:hypothetical protein